MFISKGKVISPIINENLTGICIVSYNRYIYIGGKELLTDSLIIDIKNIGASAFQQTLLINDSIILNIDLFSNTNLRRALVHLNDTYSIIESIYPIKMMEFQEGLLELGVIDAINLNMGNWSEGWYKNSNCEKITIGGNLQSKKLQTNWILINKN